MASMSVQGTRSLVLDMHERLRLMEVVKLVIVVSVVNGDGEGSCEFIRSTLITLQTESGWLLALCGGKYRTLFARVRDRVRVSVVRVSVCLCPCPRPFPVSISVSASASFLCV